MKKFFKILFFILLGIGVIWTFVYLYKKSRPQEVVYEIEDSTELISMREFCSQGCECIRIFVPIRDKVAKFHL